MFQVFEIDSKTRNAKTAKNIVHAPMLRGINFKRNIVALKKRRCESSRVTSPSDYIIQLPRRVKHARARATVAWLEEVRHKTNVKLKCTATIIPCTSSVVKYYNSIYATW